MRIPCRIVVRTRDVVGFVTRYRHHVNGDRIFIFTRVPPPVGTRVRFQIHLETGDCVLRGDGMVLRAEPDGPAQTGGMELRFVVADEPSRVVLSAMRAEPRELFTPAGPPRRCCERGRPETARFTPSVPVQMLDLSECDVDYLVDWSNETLAVAARSMLPAPPRASPWWLTLQRAVGFMFGGQR